MTEDPDRAERLERLHGRRSRQHGVIPQGPVRASANVCEAAGCLSLGSDGVVDTLAEVIVQRGLTDVAVRRVGCLGLCARGPLVDIPEHGRLFEGVTSPESVAAVADALAQETAARDAPSPFFTRQVKVVLENSGRIDPENIEDYLDHDGYQALTTALTSMQPAEVLDEVVRSGLRGRGGAGYPTGLKWSTVAKAPARTGKYVVCNADEGDPGAFMDRSVLESDPQRVLEGMAIAGYAVGASRGYIYVRAEYPLAIKRLRSAIGQAERHNLLGNGIAESTFSFDVEIRVGAGAFVCGEETALIASVEGRRGTPRPRPPYPAVAGLWAQPTLINNVETFANIAPIIRKGGAWYANIGRPPSTGTKVFALAGRVVNSGLVEVPLGITLGEIVFDIGGGIVDGGRFKAVQTGGPSGGCIPADHLDMPVDYESLAEVGSIMGSGGMIVMDQTSCMVDVAKYFMGFCRDESCGKCVPCRVGTVQLYALLDRICNGEADRGDLDRLENLCRDGHRNEPVRARTQCCQPRVQHPAVLPRRVPCPHRRPNLPGRGVHDRTAGVGPVTVHTLRIDGLDVAGTAGQTILQVARENAIDIPTLCHLDGLSDVGACRLCCVEVAGAKRPVAACVTEVTDGMEVVTRSARLDDHRRTIIEMLFVERNHVCSVCVANNNCELQAHAQALGLTHLELFGLDPLVGVDASHDRFVIDHNRCILCTRCVRVCAEIEGAHTWDVMGRGADARVVTDLGSPWGESTTCTDCGKCVQVCPTGALFEKGRSIAEAKSSRPFIPFQRLVDEPQPP